MVVDERVVSGRDVSSEVCGGVVGGEKIHKDNRVSRRVARVGRVKSKVSIFSCRVLGRVNRVNRVGIIVVESVESSV